MQVKLGNISDFCLEESEGELTFFEVVNIKKKKMYILIMPSDHLKILAATVTLISLQENFHCCVLREIFKVCWRVSVAVF